MQVCRAWKKHWQLDDVKRLLPGRFQMLPPGASKQRKKNWWVVSTYPSEKWWSSSMGRIIYPIYEMENNPNVPNNQPVLYIYISIYNPHCYPFISLVLKTKKKKTLVQSVAYKIWGCPPWFWTLQPTNGAFDPLISRVGKTSSHDCHDWCQKDRNLPMGHHHR